MLGVRRALVAGERVWTKHGTRTLLGSRSQSTENDHLIVDLLQNEHQGQYIILPILSISHSYTTNCVLFVSRDCCVCLQQTRSEKCTEQKISQSGWYTQKQNILTCKATSGQLGVINHRSFTHVIYILVIVGGWHSASQT